jgi:Skp family chaperone for outer membrane proteins
MRIWYAVGTAVLVSLFAINALWSRVPEKTGRNPHTGLINTAYVLKNWSKANEFTRELQEWYKPLQEKDRALHEQLLEVQKELLDSSIAQEKRDQLQKRVQQLNETIQKNAKEAQESLQEKTNKQVVAMNLDLETASRRYAEAHDLEVVMCYADAYTPEERSNPARIQLKLKTNSCWPIYTAAGVDISKEIVAELDRDAKTKSTPSGD